jgi:hypothetical protein
MLGLKLVERHFLAQCFLIKVLLRVTAHGRSQLFKLLLLLSLTVDNRNSRFDADVECLAMGLELREGCEMVLLVVGVETVNRRLTFLFTGQLPSSLVNKEHLVGLCNVVRAAFERTELE